LRDMLKVLNKNGHVSYMRSPTSHVSSTLKMEAVGSYETVAHNYQQSSYLCHPKYHEITNVYSESRETRNYIVAVT
jgi:hypothetical protein